MEPSLIYKIAVWALPIIFAVTLHEVAHGYVASLLGDKTARLLGRLSLNPVRHIDWIGTVLVPFMMVLFTNFVFGWAKPVPVNARNLHHPRRDMALVALAGPMANMAMALLWGILTKIGLLLNNNSGWAELLVNMGQAGIVVNIVLGALNLIPLPPLDGGKVLASLLPRRAAAYYYQLEPYGFMILLLLLFTGSLSMILNPIVDGMLTGFASLFGFNG